MRNKIFTSVFCSLFLFAGVGFFVFITIPTLSSWSAAKDWVETPAQLISQRLETSHDDDSTTYQATASFEYYFAGAQYQGNRVSLSSGSDNIGSYQQDMARKLAGIEASGGGFNVWVDPNNPANSIIDRELRVPLLLFESMFFLIFSAVGLGGIIFSFRHAKNTRSLENTDPSSPWLGKAYWASPTIKSNVKTSSNMMLVFAIFWNLISLSAFFIAVESYKEGELLGLAALIFPLIGVGLLWFAVKLKRSFRETGPMPLNLDPYPGSIGGQFGGTIALAKRNLGTLKSSNVELSCVKRYRSGKETKKKVLWQTRMIPLVEDSSMGKDIVFCFDLPPDLAESEVSDRLPYRSWKLDLELEFSNGTKIARCYENIPVFKTQQQSLIRNKQAHAATSTATAQALSSSVEDLIELQADDDGYRIYYPMGRNLWGLALVLFGLIFIGIGLAIPQLIFNIVFPGLGGICALIGFYMATNSLDVRIGPEGISSTRRILGIKIRHGFVPSYGFREFKGKASYSSTSGGKQTQYFNLIAHGTAGEKAVVVEGLKGNAELDVAIEKLNELV